MPVRAAASVSRLPPGALAASVVVACLALAPAAPLSAQGIRYTQEIRTEMSGPFASMGAVPMTTKGQPRSYGDPRNGHGSGGVDPRLLGLSPDDRYLVVGDV